MFHAIILHLLDIQLAFARGGGGGSSSGGGGGGGFSGGSSYGSGGSSGSSGDIGFWLTFIVVGIYVLIWLFGLMQKKSGSGAALKKSEDFTKDPLKMRVSEVFAAFQSSWGSFQTDALPQFVTDSFYRRIVLELTVLKALHRQNKMDGVTLEFVTILHTTGEPEPDSQTFTATINAWAADSLIDTETNTTLYTDSNPFTEYWKFNLVDGTWKLDRIFQATEAATLVSPEIEQFAVSHGFFFDADFGWLMIPKKGAIFSDSSFTESDVNNHVIGSYDGKVVEFYTFQPKASQSFSLASYLVGQVVVPSQYRDILVTRKRFWNRPPRGMVVRTLESPEFNAKFSLFADPLDEYSGWRLLSPTFMEKLTGLAFEVNIEVVDNFVYFYTKDPGVNYEQLLEVMVWAFEEMK